MRVNIGDTRIFFEVVSPKLEPVGAAMREKPTLICLHGGPGFDHTLMVPSYSRFGDIAEVIFIDHRGNGRSDADKSDNWNLAQWADDVKSFCDALDIEKPIVLGSSFGGFVAQMYGIRHPDHPSKLILTNTLSRIRWDRASDKFEKFAGKEARKIADAWWYSPSEQTWQEFLKVCMPLYGKTPVNPFVTARVNRNYDVNRWWSVDGNEGNTFNLLPDLPKIQCPTLLVAGEDDPVCPIDEVEETAEALPAELTFFLRLPKASHDVIKDGGEFVAAAIRDFILT